MKNAVLWMLALALFFICAVEGYLRFCLLSSCRSKGRLAGALRWRPSAMMREPIWFPGHPGPQKVFVFSALCSLPKLKKPSHFGQKEGGPAAFCDAAERIYLPC